MSVVIVIIGVILLFVLIAFFRLNAFLSFVVVSLIVGLSSGLPVDATVEAVTKGIGDTLGSLVIILGFGAMLGKLVSESGAAQCITTKLTNLFGIKNIQWALIIAGFIVGIPMFYSVGFVILVPLVFAVAASTGLPLLYVGLPMLASLSVTHGYLPPHPAPTAIAEMLNADLGMTLVYGVIIAIPAIIVGGAWFSRTLKNMHPKPLQEFVSEPKDIKELPPLGISIFTSLLPVILIGGVAFIDLILEPNSPVTSILHALGIPSIAMLLSVLLAIFTLGLNRGRSMSDVMNDCAEAVSSIAMILLIISGAGALKQVLVASGISDDIGHVLSSFEFSPLILVWAVTAVIRVCVGSATVAGLTSAGILLPIIPEIETPPELLVLAIGSGSLMMSHVNDGGFWLFKEYFNLSISETLKTWTVMETIVSIMGLFGVLILDQWIVT